MLLHVSILRSSSGNVYCSLLKLYVKMLITLLQLPVIRQHILCMCICCIYPMQGSRSTGQPSTECYLVLLLSISSILSFPKVIQQLLTPSFSSSRHFYPSLNISFNKVFQKAISPQDESSPLTLFPVYSIQDISLLLDLM